jgi:hypothetical protein
MTDPNCGSARTVFLLSGVLATIILVAACNGRRRRPNPGRSLSGAIHDRFARHGSLTGDGLEAGPADVTATMKRLLDSAGYATDQSGPLEGWQLRPWIRQAPRPAAGSRRRWRRRPARR